jgi:hypothetical protein
MVWCVAFITIGHHGVSSLLANGYECYTSHHGVSSLLANGYECYTSHHGVSSVSQWLWMLHITPWCIISVRQWLWMLHITPWWIISVSQWMSRPSKLTSYFFIGNIITWWMSYWPIIFSIKVSSLILTISLNRVQR